MPESYGQVFGKKHIDEHHIRRYTTTKICKECGEELPLKAFYRQMDWRGRICKKCLKRYGYNGRSRNGD